ncbi:MAG: hypothetical protein U0136_19595 [Bdellovibrionota bacterium]
MKKSSVFFTVMSSAVTLAVLCSCNQSGGSNSTAEQFAQSSTSARSAARDIPDHLGSLPCDPVGFNNAEEVLFQCSADLLSLEGAVRPSLAVWRGGESLEPISDPVAGKQFFITGFTDNGAIVGNVVNAVDVSSGGTIGFQSSYVAGFVSLGGNTQYLEKRFISQVSRSGEYLLTGEIFDDGSTGNEDSVVHNGKSIKYSPAPADIQILPSGVNDSGTMFGFAYTSNPEQTFNARYGFTRDATHFNLYPAPGRAEVSAVDSILLNDHGSLLLTYDSDVTYPFHFTGLDGEELSGSSPIRRALLQTSDGVTYALDSANPKLQTDPSLINNRDVVLVYQFEPSPESTQASTLFFSPRSGLKPADEVLPGLGTASIYFLNDKNQIIVDVGGPGGDGRPTHLQLMQLPEDF